MGTQTSSAPLPAVRSTIHPDALLAQVLPDYDLSPPLTCGLLTQSVHDNYLVTAGGACYVLRVHRYEPGLTLEEVEERARIVATLDRTGVTVEVPLADRMGHYVRPLLAPEGVRHALVVRFVPGAPVENHPTHAQAQQYGALAAHLHTALDELLAQPHRPQMDLAYLLDAPLRHLTPIAERYPALWTELLVYAEAARTTLAALALSKRPPEWGLCHGDLHKRNVLYHAAGAPTLIDWGCLGYGWRAYDVASMRRSLGQMVQPGGLDETKAERLFAAFLRGYERTRPLTDAERAAMGAFVPIRQIWIRGEGVARALASGWHPSEFDEMWLAALVASLRAWAAGQAALSRTRS